MNRKIYCVLNFSFSSKPTRFNIILCAAILLHRAINIVTIYYGTYRVGTISSYMYRYSI